MNRMLTTLGGVLIAAGLSISANAENGQHAEGQKDKQVTLQGELIDTACYTASDGKAKGQEHAECAAKCMSTGIPAAILPEGSKDPTAMRFLLTNPTVLAPYAAKTIKVEGTEHANVHAVDVTKLYVKDDAGNWKEVQLKDEHHGMTGNTDTGKDDGHTGHTH